MRNTRASQSDPRLVWIMFHKIAVMYRDLKHQKTLQSSLAIQNRMSPASFLPPQLYQPKEPSLPVKLQLVPPDLQGIQPRPSEVCNCNNIGFDPNGNWNKIVCTYKFFTCDRIWRTQTGDIAPLWCTALIFTCAGGQCFIPPVMVHQITHTTLNIYITTYPVIG